MGVVWSLRSDSEVLLEEIDEFLACYVFSSGKTHILDAYPAEIVSFLESSPRTIEEIGRHLAASLGTENAEGNIGLDILLEELRDLHILAEMPQCDSAI